LPRVSTAALTAASIGDPLSGRRLSIPENRIIDPATAKNIPMDEVYNTYRMGPNDFGKIFEKHSK